MPKTNPKGKRREAEVAAEWYARKILACVITRRAVRTKWQKVDFFGADVVGKRDDGRHVYLQVTAGGSSAVSTRRRKLENVPWHPSDIVELLQLVQTEDPANARRKLWWFRVHRYYERSASGVRNWWTEAEAVAIPKQWFTCWKENE